MARPLDEAKREAILKSATKLVATIGTGAPTARIAKDAGLSEGTLFNYFANKDDLLNQLYLEIKADLASALLDSYPTQGSAQKRCRHVWGGLIDWGVNNPFKRQAMRQLSVSERITEDSKRRGGALFQDVKMLLEESLADGTLKVQTPALIGAMLEALSEMTIEFIAREPARRDEYKNAVFEVFWNGVAR